MDTVRIGRRIKLQRSLKGYSQKDVAEKLNVSSKLVSSWETGRSMPNVLDLERLCKLLGCSKKDLIEGTEAEKRSAINNAPPGLRTIELFSGSAGMKPDYLLKLDDAAISIEVKGDVDSERANEIGEFLGLFMRLTARDQGRIIGRMEAMIEADQKK